MKNSQKAQFLPKSRENFLGSGFLPQNTPKVQVLFPPPPPPPIIGQYYTSVLGGPKMADGVWKGVYPLIFRPFCQLLEIKFFDLSTPSMRKGRVGEKGKKWKKNNDIYCGH